METSSTICAIGIRRRHVVYSSYQRRQSKCRPFAGFELTNATLQLFVSSLFFFLNIPIEAGKVFAKKKWNDFIFFCLELFRTSARSVQLFQADGAAVADVDLDNGIDY
jgi:hypothetical protein